MQSSFRRPIQVLRPGGAYDAHGRWQEGAVPTPYTVYASVQPLKGHEMALLPEGRMRSSAFWLFSCFQFRCADDTRDKNPDRVILGGRNYEILSVEDWQNTHLRHFKALAVVMSHPADGVV